MITRAPFSSSKGCQRPGLNWLHWGDNQTHSKYGTKISRVSWSHNIVERPTKLVRRATQAPRRCHESNITKKTKPLIWISKRSSVKDITKHSIFSIKTLKWGMKSWSRTECQSLKGQSSVGYLKSLTKFRGVWSRLSLAPIWSQLEGRLRKVTSPGKAIIWEITRGPNLLSHTTLYRSRWLRSQFRWVRSWEQRCKDLVPTAKTLVAVCKLSPRINVKPQNHHTQELNQSQCPIRQERAESL